MQSAFITVKKHDQRRCFATTQLHYCYRFEVCSTVDYRKSSVVLTVLKIKTACYSSFISASLLTEYCYCSFFFSRHSAFFTADWLVSDVFVESCTLQEYHSNTDGTSHWRTARRVARASRSSQSCSLSHDRIDSGSDFSETPNLMCRRVCRLPHLA